MMWFISPAATGGVSSIPLEQPPPNMPLQQDINAAFLDYAILGALDPRNLLDAKGVAKMLGISYLGGLGVAAITGAILVGAAITAADPKHKYAGGLDDTSFGQTLYGSRQMSRVSITDPLANLMYTPLVFTQDKYYS
jgi:hypothetical protein